MFPSWIRSNSASIDIAASFRTLKVIHDVPCVCYLSRHHIPKDISCDKRASLRGWKSVCMWSCPRIVYRVMVYGSSEKLRFGKWGDFSRKCPLVSQFTGHLPAPNFDRFACVVQPGLLYTLLMETEVRPDFSSSCWPENVLFYFFSCPLHVRFSLFPHCPNAA